MGCNRLKNSIYRVISVILIAVVMSGCAQKENREIPELIEPVGEFDIFRPVEKRDIYNSTILIGNVIGRDYCHFLKSSMPVKEICVDFGQYVHKGDRLAIMDVGELEKELEILSVRLKGEKELAELRAISDAARLKALEKELDMKNKRYQEVVRTNCEVYGSYAKITESTEVLDEDKKIHPDTEYYMHLEEENAKKALDGIKTEYELKKEDVNYNALLSQHRIQNYENEIDRLRKLKSRTDIIATHDGYVTYVKDLSDGNTVQAFENIVIVTDTDDLTIEIDEKYSDTFYKELINRNGECYAYKGEENYKLDMHQYSNLEYVAMESAENYANISFDLTDELVNEMNLSAGDNVPIRVVWDKVENVICIGNDSVVNSDDGSFVYVNNAGTKEKREIVTGKSYNNLTEVKEGLSVGEIVYCNSAAVPPVKYSEIKVEKTDFLPGNGMGTKLIPEYTKSHAFIQKQEALLEDVAVSNRDQVSKGDYICRLVLPRGKSLFEEKRNRVSNAEQRVESVIVNSKKQIQDFKDMLSFEQNYEERQLLQLKIDAMSLEVAVSVREAELEKEISQIEFSMDNKDIAEDGNRYIYADMDGIIAEMSASVGKKVAKEDKETLIVRILDSNSCKAAGMIEDDYVYPGVLVKFKNKNDENDVVMGTTVGSSARNNRIYLSEYEGRMYVTRSNSSGKNKIYFDVDDKVLDKFSDYEIFYPKYNIKETYVLPTKAVYSESKAGESRKTYYYVWRLVDGMSVKTYVEINPEINTEGICILDGLSEGDIVMVE